MSEQNIIIADKSALPVFTISELSISQRDEALSSASLIGKVENAAQNEKAVAAQANLKRISNSFEKSRKAMKEPLLEAGRQLDRAVAVAIAEVEKELGRLSNLTAGFALAERRRIAEEQELQRRELARIEQEKRDELLRIAAEQAESERAARQAREAAEKAAANATNEEQRIAAEAAALAAKKAAEEAKQKADAEAARAEEAAQAARDAESNPITETRATGQVVKQDWDVQIVNPYDLAKYHPDCVKIEPLLGQIKRLLNEGFSVKGVRATRTTTSTVRVGRDRNAIEI